jgi:hypothetical protein
MPNLVKPLMELYLMAAPSDLGSALPYESSIGPTPCGMLLANWPVMAQMLSIYDRLSRHSCSLRTIYTPTRSCFSPGWTGSVGCAVDSIMILCGSKSLRLV